MERGVPLCLSARVHRRCSTPGRYRVVVTGPVDATSQTFRIESSAAVRPRWSENGVRFFQVQRDGARQVAGPLHRKPSHLNDAHAAVYELPHFPHPIATTRSAADALTRVPSHAVIDAEGGWFDAGDYLKFTHTTAYADVLLYASQRALGAAAPGSLTREARHGELWLRRMWHEQSAHALPAGGDRHRQPGRHLLRRPRPVAAPAGRRPQHPHRDRYATAHRPVFRAAAPGHLISPNLVGRVSAAFALAAQNDATVTSRVVPGPSSSRHLALRGWPTRGIRRGHS